MMDKLTNGQDA